MVKYALFLMIVRTSLDIYEEYIYSNRNNTIQETFVIIYISVIHAFILNQTSLAKCLGSLLNDVSGVKSLFDKINLLV